MELKKLFKLAVFNEILFVKRLIVVGIGSVSVVDEISMIFIVSNVDSVTIWVVVTLFTVVSSVVFSVSFILFVDTLTGLVVISFVCSSILSVVIANVSLFSLEVKIISSV